jgi:hypothetical protein
MKKNEEAKKTKSERNEILERIFFLKKLPIVDEN